MKNSIVIFSENPDNLCDVAREVEKLIICHGLFDFSFFLTSDFEDCQSKLKGCKDARTAVLCDNNKLDELLENIKADSDTLTLLQEQAIKLENDGVQMLFVPLEVDFKQFLEEFFPKADVYALCVFGKSKSAVEEALKVFENGTLKHKILSKGDFLHTVLLSEQIDHDLLENAFGQSLFAFEDISLQQACARALKNLNKKLSLAQNLCDVSLFDGFENEVLDNVFVCCGQQLETLGLSSEQNLPSKEAVLSMAKGLLKLKNDGIVCCVCSGLSGGEKNFVAVGDKEEIQVFSCIFSGTKQQLKQNILHFALFRLLCFLNKKIV